MTDSSQRSEASDFVGGLQNAIQQNPVSAALIGMGVGLEFLQRLTGFRTFEIGDMTASAIGVCVGWIASPPRLPHLLRHLEARWPHGS